MWSTPVTFGGGMTMVNGSPSGLTSGENAPELSHAAYQRDSMSAGSYVGFIVGTHLARLRCAGPEV